MRFTFVQRSPPPPPKKQQSQPSAYSPPVQSGTSAPTSFRPAPTPPSTATPALDRSTSQRTPAKPVKSADIGRSNTTRDRRSPGGQGQAQLPSVNALGGQQKQFAKPSPGSSSSDLPLKQQVSPTAANARERGDPRAQAQNQPPSAAASSLAKVSGVATPRRREKKVDKGKEEDIVKRLQQICTDADPTRLYRNLVKIGQG